MAEVILLNKPYDVLCQFTDGAGRLTLADFIEAPGFYPAGRLDRDSEGLVVLTDDGALQARITHPRHKLEKTYWVQVEGEPRVKALRLLRTGLRLNDGLTAPAGVRVLAAPELWPRTPPIRERRSIPTTWLELRLREGRNRQVRRMTAAVGHPTLRLVRVAVGDWQLADLLPGQWRREPVADELLKPLPADARAAHRPRGPRAAGRQDRRRRTPRQRG